MDAEVSGPEEPWLKREPESFIALCAELGASPLPSVAEAAAALRKVREASELPERTTRNVRLLRLLLSVTEE